jgi:hypothetical protein
MVTALLLSVKNLLPGPKDDSMEVDSEQIKAIDDDSMAVDGDDGEPASTQDKESVLDRGVLRTNELDLTSYAPSSHQLFDAALRSARMCVCEGRLSIAKSRILRCQDCGYTCCEQCAGRPEHNYVPDETQRIKPGDFESEIKKALPMRLAISGFTREALEKTIESIKGRFEVDTLVERYVAAVSEALEGAEVQSFFLAI